jgi:class 3 adenylate cyclase
LEGLAEPGGICLSGVVRDQVGDRFALVFQDMGEQQVRTSPVLFECTGGVTLEPRRRTHRPGVRASPTRCPSRCCPSSI